MGQNQIIEALSNPAQITAVEEGEIREIVEAFPYFKEAQLMLTKLMHEKKHLHFHGQLKLAALYSTNREKLYELLYQKQLVETIHKVAEVAASNLDETVSNNAETLEEEVLVNTVLPHENVYPAEPEEAEKSQEVDLSEEQEAGFRQPVPITQLNFTPSEGTVEPTNNSAEEEESEKPQDLGLLEKEILSHAFSLETAYGQENETDKQEEKTTKSANNKDKTSDNLLNAWLQQQSAERAEKTEKQKHQTREIIDQFIEKDPHIQRSEQMDFDNPVDAARMSNVDNEEFVTETLARIYANQGNKEKAIAVYNKLMLKYPQKRTYFAGLIKNLKN